jgi:hypothetical protein
MNAPSCSIQDFEPTHEKRADETFSEVIKARFGGKTTAADLKRHLVSLRLDPDTLDAIEEQIRSRGESPAPAADV